MRCKVSGILLFSIGKEETCIREGLAGHWMMYEHAVDFRMYRTPGSVGMVVVSSGQSTAHGSDWASPTKIVGRLVEVAVDGADGTE